MSFKRKLQVGLITQIVIFASIFEIATLWLVKPLLDVLQGIKFQDFFSKYPFFDYLSFLKIESPEILAPLAFSFVGASAGVVRVLSIWSTLRLAVAIGNELSTKSFHNLIWQSYIDIKLEGSSQAISNLAVKLDNVIRDIIMGSLQWYTGICLCFIVASFIALNTDIFFLYISTGVILIYMILLWRIRSVIQNASKEIVTHKDSQISIIQTFFGTYKSMILDTSHDLYAQAFQDHDLQMRRGSAVIALISQSPRYLFETSALLMTGFGLCLYPLLTTQSLHNLNLITTIGPLLLAGYRLLPMIQQIFRSWVVMAGGAKGATDILKLLDRKIERPDHLGETSMKLKNEIKLCNIYYSYPHHEKTLKNINLSVSRGDHVGIIGSSGSGKSTLCDIIMGLLHPDSGELKVDGILISDQNVSEWRRAIAHVPQDVFILDANIEKNITFDLSDHSYDSCLIEKSAERSNILDLYFDVKDQDNLGDRGSKLSGGQKQRIGLARAFFSDKDIFVFDESTSSLDSDTESKVLEEISTLKNKTVIHISHRESVLKQCDYIIKIDQGRIVWKGTYAEGIQKSLFRNIQEKDSYKNLENKVSSNPISGENFQDLYHDIFLGKEEILS